VALPEVGGGGVGPAGGVPRLALGPDGVELLLGRLVDVVLQPFLEVLDVARDGQELENLGALALRVAVELAVLRQVPLALPEDAARGVSLRFFFFFFFFFVLKKRKRQKGRLYAPDEMPGTHDDQLLAERDLLD